MGTRRLVVELVGDPDHLSRTFKRVDTQSDRLSKRMVVRGAAMARSFAVVGAAAGSAAVVGIKKSIDATADLSKTTVGLHRNLGLSIEEASRWGSVAKARDIDTKSMVMSFTTLSRRVQDVREGGESSVPVFNRLGISQQELIKHGDDFNWVLNRVARGFGEAEGGAQRQAAAQQLLGRGYQTLLPLFSSGTKSLREQQQWADKYHTTLDAKTLKSMDRLVTAQREQKVAWLGLQVAVARETAPAVARLTEEFNELAAIISDPDLSDEQKMQAVSKRIERLSDLGVKAIEVAVPRIAEHSARAAPEIAVALVNGFLEADVWGKLLIAGWLVKRFGGAGALTAAGRRMGTLVGGGMMGGMTYNLGGPAATKAGRRWGRLFGAAAAIAMLPYLKDTFNDFKDLVDDIFDQETDQTHREGFAARINQSPVLGAKTTQFIGKDQIRVIDRYGKAWTLTTPKIRAGEKATEAYSRALRKFQRNSETAMNRYRAALTKAARRSDRATVNIGGNFRSLNSIIAEALGNIRDNVNQGLGKFGAKKLSFVLRTQGIPELGPSVIGQQTGGFAGVVPGNSTGDKHLVAARVESGEGLFVMNRNAMGALVAMNAAVPRFQAGGVALPRPVISGPGAMRQGGQGASDMVWRAGKKYLARHAGPSNLAGATRLAQQMGLVMTSGFRPGDDGWHGRDRARDYAGSSAQMLAFARRMLPFHRRLLELIYTPLGKSVKNGAIVAPYAQADHYDHVHVAMQRGGRVPRPKRGSHWIRGGSRWSADEAATLIWQAGGSKREAALLSAKVFGESGGNPKAVGKDPGGTRGLGLWQITTGHNDDLIRRFSPIMHPVNNAMAALAILRRQGIGAWYAPSSAPGRILHNRIGGKASGGKGGGGTKPKGDSGSAYGPLGGHGLTFEDKLALLDIAATQADATPSVADDMAVINKRLRLLIGRRKKVDRKIAAINKRLRGKLTAKERKRLIAKRSELLSDSSSLLSDIAALRGEKAETSGASGESSNALLTEIRDELKQLNKLAQAGGTITGNEAVRAFADMISGELGGRAFAQAATAGTGTVGRF